MEKVSLTKRGAILVLAAIFWQCDGDGLEAPKADFTADATTIPAGTVVNFTDLSTGVIDSWSWSFPGGDPNSFSSPNPQITYNEPGVYNVSLQVSNELGPDVETKENYMTVLFDADFQADNTLVAAGQTIFFTDASRGTAVEWNWSFPGGDPESSTDQNVAVTYNDPGTYDVTLQASDGANNDTETKTGFITVQ